MVKRRWIVVARVKPSLQATAFLKRFIRGTYFFVVRCAIAY
jgi:hypothetical protein